MSSVPCTGRKSAGARMWVAVLHTATTAWMLPNQSSRRYPTRCKVKGVFTRPLCPQRSKEMRRFGSLAFLSTARLKRVALLALLSASGSLVFTSNRSSDRANEQNNSYNTRHESTRHESLVFTSNRNSDRANEQNNSNNTRHESTLQPLLIDCQHIDRPAVQLFPNTHSNTSQSFCLKRRNKHAAVLYHLGNRPSREFAKQWRYYLQNLYMHTESLDLFVNIRNIAVVNELCTFGSNLGLETFITVQEENRGADIGGFFVSLAATIQQCNDYKFVLKAHAKSSETWARRMISPLLGSPRCAQGLVQLFDKPHTGMVASFDNQHKGQKLVLSWGSDKASFALTTTHEERLLAELEITLPRAKRVFHAGGIIALNGPACVDALREKLASFYYDLNTPRSFDWNWYRLMKRLISESKEEVEAHFKAHGNNIGNSYVRHHSPGYYPDAQVEHAWERVLTYLIVHRDMDIVFQKSRVGGFFCKGPSLGEIPVPKSSEWCMRNNESASCLLWAVTGECEVLPSLRVVCPTSCGCIKSYRSHFHSARALGPFNATSARVERALQSCPLGEEVNFGHLLLLNDLTRLWACTRYQNVEQKVQLIFDKSGTVSTYDLEFNLLWRSRSIRTHKHLRSSPKLQLLRQNHTSLLVVADESEIPWKSAPFNSHENYFLALTEQGRLILTTPNRTIVHVENS